MARPESLFLRAPYGEPLIIERAQGAYLYSHDGRKILDAAAGAVVVNIGQGRSEVAEVARRQIEQLNYVVPVWITPARQRLVERLAKWVPEGMDRFFFTSGGSEAVEMALKFALLYQRVRGREGRTRIISRWLSYHGNTLAALSVGGNRARRADYEDALYHWPKIGPSYCYRCPWGKSYPGCGLECAEALEQTIAAEGADRIAAFIAEPIVGASGGIIPPVPEYWPRIEAICRRHDIVLIADEVMTGFGRTGKRMGVDHWGIRPDIILSAKGLTGGYFPMGMIAADHRLIEACEQAGRDFMFFTYTAQPLGCAIADKVLEILEREELVERAARLGAILGERLQALKANPMVGDIRGSGLFWGLELVADAAGRQPYPAAQQVTRKVVAAALKRGLYIYPSSGMAGEQGGDAVMITPPFVIGEAEIEFIASTLEQALAEVGRQLANPN